MCPSESADGYAATIRPSVGSTIRPEESAATLAAPASVQPRDLPNLSVDLRASLVPPAPDIATEADLELMEVIGEGGMGRVFLARQHSLSRDVAVKTPKNGADEFTKAALVTEGRITGQLEHPAIVPVHALGLDKQGRPAMVMKRIEGVEWQRLARDPRHPGWAGWPGSEDDRTPGHLQIFIAICNAVHFANTRGVVHRDIKLENVLIGRFGDVYLADWGIAGRAGTLQRTLCGTPGYLAPEMVGGRIVDARTDVYLLGATLHDIFTGAMRHQAASVAESVQLASVSAPHSYDENVPEEIAELINRACHAEPDERPQSAESLRDEVTQILSFRSAAELAGEALDRTSRIRRLVSADHAQPEDAEVRQELERLVAEARFAFERAFATGWRGTDEVREAHGWLKELIAERAARVEALEREAKEHDPRTGAKHRALALSALAAVGLATTLYAIYTEHDATVLELFLFPLLLITSSGIFAFAARKQLAQTAYSRRAVGMVIILLGTTCISRGFALIVDITTASQLRQDSIMMAAGLAVGSLAWAKWLRWMALCFAASYVGCVAWPDIAIYIFGVLSAFSLFVAAAFQWLESRKSP